MKYCRLELLLEEGHKARPIAWRCLVEGLESPSDSLAVFTVSWEPFKLPLLSEFSMDWVHTVGSLLETGILLYAYTLAENAGLWHLVSILELCTSKENSAHPKTTLGCLLPSSPPPSLFSPFVLSFCFFFFSSHHFCQNLRSKHSEWCAQLGGLACASCPISPGSCSRLCPAPTQVPSSALGWFSAKNPLMENTGEQCRLYWRVLWLAERDVFIRHSTENNFKIFNWAFPFFQVTFWQCGPQTWALFFFPHRIHWLLSPPFTLH